MSRPNILIVEDDNELREALIDTLELAGYDAAGAESAETALQLLSGKQVDLVISDVNMSGMNGMELLRQVREDYPLQPVVLMTAYGSIEHSVTAMRQGAADYLVKPFQPQDLLETVNKHISLHHRGDSESPVAEDMSSRTLLKLAKKVAVSDATVLITGESGTGKEVLARYVHSQSQRMDGPFVAINCAAIPETMLEATLFGYEKGAFTGAYNSSEGKFEQADGGTLLLDEISEMDAGLQAKILRVLQEREVERLGGKKTIQLNVRVIATSNRDLKQCVQEGSFREDLYYRLSVFPLAWLPLRERKGDILPLAEKLLAAHGKKMARTNLKLDESAERAMTSYAWPGNVRELDNTIQRAIVMQDGDRISMYDLSLGQEITCTQEFSAHSINVDSSVDNAQIVVGENPEQDDPGSLGSDLKQREFEIILTSLRENGGRRNKTAESLGISARTLRYKMARIRESGINIENMMHV